MRKAVIWPYFQPFMRKHPKVFEWLGFFKNASALLKHLKGLKAGPG